MPITMLQTNDPMLQLKCITLKRYLVFNIITNLHFIINMTCQTTILAPKGAMSCLFHENIYHCLSMPPS
jgi:hypothetical protein